MHPGIWNLGKHVEAVTTKAENKAAKLARLMINVKGPNSSKGSVLCGVIHSILLYGAPVWHTALRMQKYRNKLENAQRTALLRVTSAYRTVSTLALQVVAAVVPIDLLVHERTHMYTNSGKENKKILGINEREASINNVHGRNG